jgi:hypothetical protein
MQENQGKKVNVRQEAHCEKKIIKTEAEHGFASPANVPLISFHAGSSIPVAIISTQHETLS